MQATRAKPCHSLEGDCHAADGFIVVAALWILAALAALAMIYLTYVTNTAVVVSGTTDRLQIDALATAGVELTAYRLGAFQKDLRPSSGRFRSRIGPAEISVAFQSEASRIDLNAAPKELLAGLMRGLGTSASNAASYADRIDAWRTPGAAAANDTENSFYRTAGLAYLPRHAPFPQVEELWLVYGIPPFLIEQMMPFVTVFGGGASINVFDAAPQVMAALPGMTPDKLQALLSGRDDSRTDPQSLLKLAGGEASLTGSGSYRVTIGVGLGGGRKATVEAVILLLDDGDEPYRILSWRNGTDGSSAPVSGQAGGQ
ncbi:type II secretion system protein GspK [Bradyrhizobium prioriisuperbiae]|uniref:general secretion pathway protein GspK n=1 Tax=Bradyrhizobium prioriisuperbiae TaxID=2854389 RepID=UPI0028E5D6FF|nr:type II secretion system protein GspK [Bradyrhizobium prioritasuperba]